MRGYNIEFFVSDQPKNVFTRYTKADPSFRSITNENDFIRVAQRCTREKGIYMHLFLPLKRTPFLIMDIDSKRNSILALKYNEMLLHKGYIGLSPFINPTPHGAHLFF